MIDDTHTLEYRGRIRARLHEILKTIDAPVTAKMIYNKTSVRWQVENIESALRLMARDGECREVCHDKHGKWYVHKQWSEKKAAPVATTESREQRKKETRKETPMATETNSVDLALDSLETRMRERHHIEDADLKDKVLARLGGMLDPSITRVLESIRQDLQALSRR